ncbi:D-amino-acid oxidase [Nematostella vectensis]|uniref:D-amino-acid oxidase n=1 Tax=Nematostella vectensis TaxID=45351 RepID=UPI0020773F60|nr:D-amino-acid oxidase [Nematostella vectensis]
MSSLNQQPRPCRLSSPFGGQRVLVIGAGVIGLTTAYELLTAGYEVTVLAKEFPIPGDPVIVSLIAGALWVFPTKMDCFEEFSRQKIEAWAMVSYDKLVQQAKNGCKTGVKVIENVYLFKDIDGPTMEFINKSKHLPKFRHSPMIIKEKGINTSPHGVKDAVSFWVPVINSPSYMMWLYQQCQQLGVKYVRASLQGTLLSQLNSLMTSYNADFVINCTGLAAKELATDDKVYPVRGALINVPSDALNIDYRLAHGFKTEYGGRPGENAAIGRPSILPHHNNDPSMGSLGVFYQSHEYNTNLSLSHPLVKKFLQQCIAMYPPVGSIKEKDMVVKVGLRPVRSGGPRVEPDPSNPRLIHNYGHGAIGYILSWGCAKECLEMVRSGNLKARL